MAGAAESVIAGATVVESAAGAASSVLAPPQAARAKIEATRTMRFMGRVSLGWSDASSREIFAFRHMASNHIIGSTFCQHLETANPLADNELTCFNCQDDRGPGSATGYSCGRLFA
jgi:hypothetical protein